MRVSVKILTIVILGLSSTVSWADVFVPAGLNPGDQYQIAFVTDGGIDATSFNISTYNDFAVAQAALNPSLTGTDMGVSYSAIASTDQIDANVNALVQAPVYLLDSTLLATGFSDMWDGSLNSSIDINQFGQQQIGSEVWTGSFANGLRAGSLELGNSNVSVGNLHFSDSRWMHNLIVSNSNTFSMYALSDVLTVSVPEPTTTGILLGLSLFAICRRQSRAR